MSRELSSVTASMKAQPVLLSVPSAEETLFDFVNEDEVKVRLVQGRAALSAVDSSGIV
jgi:hypothetical protein